MPATTGDSAISTTNRVLIATGEAQSSVPHYTARHADGRRHPNDVGTSIRVLRHETFNSAPSAVAGKAPSYWHPACPWRLRSLVLRRIRHAPVAGTGQALGRHEPPRHERARLVAAREECRPRPHRLPPPGALDPTWNRPGRCALARLSAPVSLLLVTASGSDSGQSGGDKARQFN